MKTYSFHSDPDALYLWNTRVTKSFLEDIQHVVVRMRPAAGHAPGLL